MVMIAKEILSKNKILLTVFLYFIFILLLDGVLFNGETQTLANAKHFMNKDWIKNDWFLNRNINYRIPFNFLIGSLTLFMPLYIVSILGRGAVFLLFAYCFQRYAKAFNLKLEYIIVFLFFLHHSQSIVAGEWMVGTLETKEFAYICILLSFPALLNKRINRVLLFLGLSISFHVLIGVYATLTTILFVFLNYQYFKEDIFNFVKKSYIFVIASSFGIYSIVTNLIATFGVDTSPANSIYLLRNAHHIFPAYWTGFLGIIKLVLSLSFLIVTAIFNKKKEYKLASIYALSSFSFFLIGMFIYWTNNMNLLKYYWFRFPDVILPFFSFFLFFATLNGIIENRSGLLSKLKLSKRLKEFGRIFIVLGAIVILFIGMFTFVSKIKKIAESSKPIYLQESVKEFIDVMVWAKKNSDRESVFLVSPTISNFYIGAERAVFVSFKHVPQSEKDLIEWYNRMKLCNNNEELSELGFRNTDTLDNNFYNLGDHHIKEISEMYNVTYYLGKKGKNRTLNSVYENDEFVVYYLGES